MATTTPNFGWSVPTSTDYVAQGAVAIETLGDAIDLRFGNITTYPNQIVNRVGAVTRPLPYAMEAGRTSMTSIVAGSTSSTVTITFTASRFTQPPIVYGITNNAFNAVYWPLTIRALTSSSVTLAAGGAASPGSAGFECLWTAVQMTSATAAG